APSSRSRRCAPRAPGRSSTFSPASRPPRRSNSSGGCERDRAAELPLAPARSHPAKPMNWLLAFSLSFLVAATCLPAQPAPKQADRAPATATLIPLSENWRMDGDVPVHALLISLQGLANRDQPRVYLEYPKNWQWEIVHPLIGFLERRHAIKFDRHGLDDADAALARFAKYAKGCVVWDKSVRSSLIVAYDAAFRIQIGRAHV